MTPLSLVHIPIRRFPMRLSPCLTCQFPRSRVSARRWDPEEAAQCRQAWLTGGDICPLCDRSQFWSLADSLLRDLAQKTHHRKVPRKWKCKGHQIRANVPEYFDNEKPYFSVSSIYVPLLCSIFLQRDPFFPKKRKT